MNNHDCLFNGMPTCCHLEILSIDNKSMRNPHLITQPFISSFRLLSLLLPLLCTLLQWPHLYTPLLLSTPPLLLPPSTLLQLLPSSVPDTLGKQWQPPGKSHDPYQLSLKRKSNLPSFTTKNSTNNIHCPFNWKLSSRRLKKLPINNRSIRNIHWINQSNIFVQINLKNHQDHLFD